MTRSTAPRTRAGISSSTAEWIAEYSPPTPAPVMTRQTKNHAKFMLNAVRMLPARKTPSVIMNSRLREGVGQSAEEQRAGAGAGDIRRARRADLGRGQFQARA